MGNKDKSKDNAKSDTSSSVSGEVSVVSLMESPKHNSTKSEESNPEIDALKQEIANLRQEQTNFAEKVEEIINKSIAAERQKFESEKQKLEAKIAENKRDINISLTKIVDGRVELTQENNKRISEVENKLRNTVSEVQRVIESRVNELSQKQTSAVEESRLALTSGLEALEQTMKDANGTIQFDVDDSISCFHRELEKQREMINREVEKHEQQKTEISQKIKTIEEKTSRRVVGFANHVQTAPSWERDIKIPSYDGTHKEKPMSYLEQLTAFCESRNMTENEIGQVIRQSLGGIAQDWWGIVRKPEDTFNDFKRKFQQKFWSDEAQRKVKRNLEFGSYRQEQFENRVEYAIRRFSNAKDLRPAIPESEIVECLSRHFDETIHSAVITRGISDIQTLITLLEKFDNARRPNQVREQNQNEQSQSGNRVESESNLKSNGENRNTIKSGTNTSNGHNTYKNQPARQNSTPFHTHNGARPKPFDTEARYNNNRTYSNSHIQVEENQPVQSQSFELPKLGN